MLIGGAAPLSRRAAVYMTHSGPLDYALRPPGSERWSASCSPVTPSATTARIAGQDRRPAPVAAHGHPEHGSGPPHVRLAAEERDGRCDVQCRTAEVHRVPAAAPCPGVDQQGAVAVRASTAAWPSRSISSPGAGQRDNGGSFRDGRTRRPAARHHWCGAPHRGPSARGCRGQRLVVTGGTVSGVDRHGRRNSTNTRSARSPRTASAATAGRGAVAPAPTPAGRPGQRHGQRREHDD